MESPVAERAVVVEPPPSSSLVYTAGCTNDDPKRLKVLEELMATEQHYIKDLSVLIRNYIVPLRNSQILTENDVEQLCFNIEAIEALHVEIFNTMSHIIETHRNDLSKPLTYFIGEYFFSLEESLKIYSTYSSETPERIAKDPLFVMFLDRMRAGTGSKLHLDDYLIKPIQRICKYPLLFRELERASPPGDEYAPFFQDLVRTLDAIVQLVNDTRKQFEAVKRVIEVESMLTDLPEPLVASGRVLVKEGPLLKQSPREGSFRQERYCFLFRGPVRQDTLVYTKMKNKKSYMFRGKLDLFSCYLKDLSPQVGFVISNPNSPKTYTFFCKTQAEKQTWMAELSTMVLPNKPTGSFLKSASFQASRPPAQTVSNRLSGGVVPAANNPGSVVNIGSVKFRNRQQTNAPNSSFLDGADAGDGPLNDTPPTNSPVQKNINWSKLRGSNDGSSESDDISGSPTGQDLRDGSGPNSVSPTMSIPPRSATQSFRSAPFRVSSLSSIPSSSSSFIRSASTDQKDLLKDANDDQREIQRLQTIISALEAKLQVETSLRIRLEKEMEVMRQRLHHYEGTQPSAIVSPRRHQSDDQDQLLVEQQQLIQQQLQKQQQQLLLQQQILLQHEKSDQREHEQQHQLQHQLQHQYQEQKASVDTNGQHPDPSHESAKWPQSPPDSAKWPQSPPDSAKWPQSSPDSAKWPQSSPSPDSTKRPKSLPHTNATEGQESLPASTATPTDQLTENTTDKLTQPTDTTITEPELLASANVGADQTTSKTEPTTDKNVELPEHCNSTNSTESLPSQWPPSSTTNPQAQQSESQPQPQLQLQPQQLQMQMLSPPQSPTLRKLHADATPDIFELDQQEPEQNNTTTQQQGSETLFEMLPAILRGVSDSALAMPDFEEDYAWIKEGSLTKMGDVRQNWKARWFRLAPGFLLYFKSFRDPPKKYLGVVHLTKDVTVARSTKKMFCVAIHTPSREWLLCAVTEREANEWVQALTSAIGGQ